MFNDFCSQDLMTCRSGFLVMDSPQLTLSTTGHGRDIAIDVKDLPHRRVEIKGNAKTLSGSDGAAAVPESFGWFSCEPEELVIEMVGRVAVITFNGVVRPTSMWWSSTPGLEELTKAVLSLSVDVGVDRTVVRGTSPGGLTYRLEDFVAAVKQHSSVKPIDFFGSDIVLSAAYWMAAAFDSVWVDSTTSVGGLGVFTLLFDTKKHWEEMGVFTVLVNDNSLGLKGHDHDFEVSEALVADTRNQVLTISSLFRERVSAGRGLSLDETDKLFTGEHWVGAEALEIGLVDGVQPWFEYIARLSGDDEVVLRTETVTDTNGDEDMAELRDGEPESNALSRALAAIFAAGKQVNEQPEQLSQPESTVSAHLVRAATVELTAHVDGIIRGMHLTPGMKAVSGFHDTLCLLAAVSVLGDSKKTSGFVDTCPSAYDYGELMGWDKGRAMVAAMEMFPLASDPFTSVMATLGAVPEFTATGRDIVSVKDVDVPRGGGEAEQGDGKFTRLQPGLQTLLLSMSDGRIKDDASYESALP